MRRTDRFAWCIAAFGVVWCPGLADAQPVGVQRAETKSDPVPVEIALHDLYEAYAGTTADAVQVRFRAPGGAERSDDLVVRLQVTADSLQRARFDLGALRISAGAGKVLVVNTNVPAKFLERDYTGPLTPAALAGLTPPIPLPQLSLAVKDGFHTPTPYTPEVHWTDAAIETSIRGRFLTLSGVGANCKVTISANPDTGRLVHLVATLRSRDGESTLDLAVHAVDPADPASWAINTAGRERIKSLSELRPVPAPSVGEIQSGQPVPDLTFSNPDHSRWSLHPTLAAAAEAARPGPAPALVLILYRGAPLPDRAAEAIRDAQAGRAALRAIDAAPASPDGPHLSPHISASAVIIELADFSPERWNEAQQSWSGAPASNPAPAAPLLWASSAAQSIDRFVPGAQAVMVVIASDRTLRSAIRLDGRGGEADRLREELAAALAPR